MATSTQAPALYPALPLDLLDGARMEETRLRRRLLYGLWSDDLAGRMRKNLGNVRAEAIGEPDMAANPFEAVCSAAAALYDRIPRLHQADSPSRDAMVALTERAMLYPLMARVQRDVLGMREEFLRVSCELQQGAPKVVYTPAFADLVVPKADPRDPTRPIRITEYVLRPDPRDPDEQIWTQEIWDIEGTPRHHVLDAEGKVDLSNAYGLPAGGLVGEAYPAIRADGRPILPYATYHAAATGALLDPWHRRELVQGVLNVGVLWTFFAHCVRAASWPQRWISGGFIAGAAADDNTGVRRIVADPATIMEILQDPQFEGQVTAGQWGSASDPKAVAEAISIYEQRFVGYVEIGAEFWRGSSDPRSGIALSLDRTGRIEAQRRYGPIFAPVDAEVLSITATMVNRRVGSPLLAEDGWKVEHLALQPPLEQRKVEREETLALLEAGLITKAEARARITGEDLAEAKRGVAAAAAEAQPPTQPPDPSGPPAQA